MRFNDVSRCARHAATGRHDRQHCTDSVDCDAGIEIIGRVAGHRKCVQGRLAGLDIGARVRGDLRQRDDLVDCNRWHVGVRVTDDEELLQAGCDAGDVAERQNRWIVITE